MKTRQREALANPNLEFGASTFLGIPVGPNQMLSVYRDDPTVMAEKKRLYNCPDGASFINQGGESELELVVLPSNFSTLNVEPYVFSGCRKMVTMIGIEDLATIPQGMCSECEELVFSKLNATMIGEGAFYFCLALTRVELPNVSEVKTGVFANCPNLTVVLNDNVVNVGTSAFEGIDNLIYHGSLPGAPWGATKWNGVPQN